MLLISLDRYLFALLLLLYLLLLSSSRTNIDRSKRLEKYLRNLEIDVSSRELVYRFNLAKIKNEDVDCLLRKLLRSMEEQEPSLYDGLVSLLGDETLVGKVKRTRWSDVPRVFVLRPELLQVPAIVVLVILEIFSFFLTGEVVL